MPLYLQRKISAQPKSPVPVDRGNRITNGILFATTPVHWRKDAANDRLTYNFGTYGSATSNKYIFEPSIGGLGYRPIDFSEATATATTGSATNHTLMALLSVDADAYPINAQNVVAWGDNNSFFINIGTTGIVTISNGGSGYVSTTSAPPLRKVVAIISVVDSSGTTVYIDGQVAATSATAPAKAANTTIRPYGYVASGGTVYKSIRIYLSAGWTRSFTSAEVLSISKNPWQIFKPYTTIFVPLSAAPPATTIYEFQSLGRGVGRGIARGIS